MRKITPPNDYQAEISLISAFFLDANATMKAIRKVNLSSDDFYESKNKYIFSACLKLYEQGVEIELPSVVLELQKEDKLEQAGGPGYIAEVMGVLPAPANVELYARRVKDLATIRRYLATAKKIEVVALDTDNPETVKKVAEEILDLDSQKSKFISAEELAQKEVDFWEVNAHGVKVQSRAIFGIVGATSTGKTELAMDVAYSFAKQGGTVLFCEYEGAEDELAIRVKRKGDWKGLDVTFSIKPSLLDIASFVAKHKNERTLVVIDYLQRVGRMLQTEEKRASDSLRIYVNRVYEFFDELRNRYSNVSTLFLMSMGKADISRISAEEIKNPADMLNAVKESGDVQYDLDYAYSILFTDEHDNGKLYLSRFRKDGVRKFMTLLKAKEARVGSKLENYIIYEYKICDWGSGFKLVSPSTSKSKITEKEEEDNLEDIPF